MLARLIRKMKYALLCRPYFATADVKIGRNVSFGVNVVFNCKRVRIGDGVVFKENITINSDVFEIGDYGTIYHNCFFPGPGKLVIGHNFWLGTASIVDSQGGTIIGNNVGVGPHSQLWGHMKYGDVLYGCRFHGVKPLEIHDDVWLVGHCLVSPVRIGARSMAMLGSLVTRDMAKDRTYAGVPAKDVTEKLGRQFRPTSVEERVDFLKQKIQLFARRSGFEHHHQFARIVTNSSQVKSATENVTVFNVEDRTYFKSGSATEYHLMRFLLTYAKFIPADL